MTREEAIEMLNNVREYTDDEAIDMAIEALSADAVHIETYRELYEKYVNLKHASVNAVQGDECDHCVYKWGTKGGDYE